MKHLISIALGLLLISSCSNRSRVSNQKPRIAVRDTFAMKVMDRYLDSMGYVNYETASVLGMHIKEYKVSGDSAYSYVQANKSRSTVFWSNEYTYNDRVVWGYGRGWQFDFSNGATGPEPIDSVTAYDLLTPYLFHYRIVEGYFNRYKELYNGCTISTKSGDSIVVSLMNANESATITLDTASFFPRNIKIERNEDLMTIHFDKMVSLYQTPVVLPQIYRIYENGKLAERVIVTQAMLTAPLKERVYDLPE